MSETHVDPSASVTQAQPPESTTANAPDPTAAPSASAPTTKPNNDAWLGFAIWGFVGAIWFWVAVKSWLLRGIAIGVVAIGVIWWVAWIWKKGQAPATWESVKRQVRLLVGLILTILGAPAAAVLLANNDRMLALKLTVIVLLSFLPAALYWQFIAGKGRALWDEFVINLYRLGIDHPVSLPEPPVESVFHALWRRERGARDGDTPPNPRNNLYLKKFEGVYGTLSDALTQRVLAENALPVVFATLFISLGWVLVLQPETVFFRTLFGQRIPAGSVSLPLREIGFAFLGAYFYSLQMLMRRYYQNDLKTSAYINVAMRVVIVVLLTWILSEVWKGDPSGVSAPWRYGVAFTIGVFPDVGWHLLQQLLKLPARWIDDSFRVRCKLSAVDGLNPWYQARLLEEGIEDMQTLVTANLVDVMLHTRIPIERLVDWIDQSVLLLHLPDEVKDDDAGRAANAGAAAVAEDARAVLARLGIRKATELLSVYNASAFTFKVTALAPAGGPNDPIAVLVAVAETVRREPVLHHVVQWKNFPHEYLESVGQPQTGVGALLPPSAQAARRSLGVEPVGDVLSR